MVLEIVTICPLTLDPSAPVCVETEPMPVRTHCLFSLDVR